MVKAKTRISTKNESYIILLDFEIQIDHSVPVRRLIKQELINLKKELVI